MPDRQSTPDAPSLSAARSATLRRELCDAVANAFGITFWVAYTIGFAIFFATR